MNTKQNPTPEEYLALPYTVMLRRDEEGGFIARVKELEGCVADGGDEQEALNALRSMMSLWITMALKKGMAIPIPESEEQLPSGKWLQRVPRSLHGQLSRVAEQEGVSLNQLVTSMLAEALGRRNNFPTKREHSHPDIVVHWDMHGSVNLAHQDLQRWNVVQGMPPLVTEENTTRLLTRILMNPHRESRDFQEIYDQEEDANYTLAGSR